MTVKRISPHDPAWLNFIEQRDDAMIFHHPYWIKNLEETYQYKTFVLIVESGDQQILAGVPMAEISSFLTGRRWVSLPFSDWCAPLAVNDLALEELTDGLVAISREPGVPNIELRWQYPARPEISESQANVLHIGHFSKESENELLAQFKQKIRYCIRTSINRGIHVESGSSPDFLEKFYRLQCLTRRRHGVPVQPRKYFMNLGKNVLDKGLGRVLLAYSGEECVAGEVFLHFKDTITMKYGASGNVDLTNLHPNYLLDWEVIKWGAVNGYNNFDCGRCDVENTGLRQYKNQWGYQEIPLTYSFLGSVPAKKSGAEGLMTAVIRRAPLWVCRAAGELCYRHVG